MEQLNCTTGKAKYKHFTERQYKLEGHLEAKLSIKEISKKLKKHPATVLPGDKEGPGNKDKLKLNRIYCL